MRPSTPPAAGRRVPVAVAVLVAAVLAAWGAGWLLADGEGPVESGAARSSPGSHAEDGPASAAGVRAPDSGGSTIEPLEGAAEAGARARWEGCNLRLRVVEADTGEPLPDVSLSLYASASTSASVAASGSVQDPAGLLGNPIGVPDARSDEDGLALLCVPPGVRLRLIAYGSAERIGQRLLSIAALGPDERREVLVELPTAEGFEFWGRALDADTGDVVPGATVVLFGGARGSDAARMTSPKRPVGGTRTDARGLFVVHPAPFTGAYARLEAEGYGPVLTEVTAEHTDPASAQDLALTRAAGLDAEVLDGNGAPLKGAVLTVSAAARYLTRPEGIALYADDLRWEAEIGWDGLLSLRGLPAGAPLVVEITLSGRALLRDDGGTVLQPGQVLARTWRLAGRTRLTGRVLDQAGAAVADVALWLTRPALPGRFAGQPGFLEAGDVLHVVARSRTDAAGMFAFPDVPAGGWLLGPAPRELAGPVPDADAVSSWACFVEILPDRPETRVTLEVSRGLTVRGTVAGPDGSLLSSRVVRAWPADSATTVTTRTDVDGAFTLGPLTPGTWSVQASGGEGTAPSQAVVVQAGADDVALHLGSPASLGGRIVTPEGDEHGSVRVVAWADGPRGDEPAGRTWSGPDGQFLFDGLAAGRYDLTAQAGAGRMGILRGLHVAEGEVVEGLELALEAGAPLRIRYDGTARYGRFTVLCSGSIVAVDSVHTGTARLVTVPPGPVEVRFSVADRPVETRTLEAEAGTATELRFTDA